MQISSTPISGKYQVACPSCAATVFVVHPDKCEVPGGGYWLRDGDTVGPLFSKLSEQQKTLSEHQCVLMVGRCRSCNRDHYVTEASFMVGAWDDVADYMLMNRDTGPMRNLKCTTSSEVEGLPAEWLMHEYQTDVGPLHVHLFGPWALDSIAGVEGPYGVSSCGGAAAEPWQKAANVLFLAWDAMQGRCLHATRAT